MGIASNRILELGRIFPFYREEGPYPVRCLFFFLTCSSVLAASNTTAGDLEEEAQDAQQRRMQIEREEEERLRMDQEIRDHRTREEYHEQIGRLTTQRDQAAQNRQSMIQRDALLRDEANSRAARQHDLWGEQSVREMREDRQRVERRAEEDRQRESLPWPKDAPERNAYRQIHEDLLGLQKQIDQLVQAGRVDEADALQREVTILHERLNQVARPRPFGAAPPVETNAVGQARLLHQAAPPSVPIPLDFPKQAAELDAEARQVRADWDKTRIRELHAQVGALRTQIDALGHQADRLTQEQGTSPGNRGDSSSEKF